MENAPTFFAQIDENNLVTAVHVVTAQFIQQNPDRYPGTWVQTYWNTPGKTYAGVGYTYDETTDNFAPPPPPNIG